MISWLWINSFHSVVVYKDIIQYSTIVVSAGEVDTVAGIAVDVRVVDGEPTCSIEMNSITTIIINLTIVDCYIVFIWCILCFYTILVIEWLYIIEGDVVVGSINIDTRSGVGVDLGIGDRASWSILKIDPLLIFEEIDSGDGCIALIEDIYSISCIVVYCSIDNTIFAVGSIDRYSIIIVSVYSRICYDDW